MLLFDASSSFSGFFFLYQVLPTTTIAFACRSSSQKKKKELPRLVETSWLSLLCYTTTYKKII
jgi:hypothetical protein